MDDLRIQTLALGIDLEEFQPRNASAGQGCTPLPELVGRLLERFATRGVRATFFTVGETAEKFPGLVRDIAQTGHEIASHSFAHRPVLLDSPESFETDLLRSIETLGRVGDCRVIGYRAPLLSVTQATQWVYPILHRSGIEYSSSVLPARNIQYGWSGHSLVPTVHEGVVEIPLSVARFAGRFLPLAGGAYFRILPQKMIFDSLRAQGQASLVTTYFHPYDYDTRQTFSVHRELVKKPWLAPLLFFNRKHFLERLDLLLNLASRVVSFSQYNRENSADSSR